MKITLLTALAGLITLSQTLSLPEPVGHQLLVNVHPFIDTGAPNIANAEDRKSSTLARPEGTVGKRDVAVAEKKANGKVDDKKDLDVKKATKFLIVEKNLFSHDCAHHLAGVKQHPKGADAVCDIRIAKAGDDIKAASEHYSFSGASAQENERVDFSAFYCATSPSSPSCYHVTAAGLFLRLIGGRVVQRNHGFSCSTALERYGVRISLCSDRGDWLHSATVATIVGWFKNVCLGYDTQCEGFVILNRKGSRIIAAGM